MKKYSEMVTSGRERPFCHRYPDLSRNRVGRVQYCVRESGRVNPRPSLDFYDSAIDLGYYEGYFGAWSEDDCDRGKRLLGNNRSLREIIDGE